MAIHTFGNTTTGSYGVFAANTKAVSKIKNVNNLKLYLSSVAINFFQAATASIQCVIYSDLAGAPDQLISSSVAKTSVVAGWNTFQIAGNPIILQGQSVWVGVITQQEVYVGGFPTTNGSLYITDTYSDGATTTFGAYPTSYGTTLAVVAEGYSTPDNKQPRNTAEARMRILHDNSADRAALTASSTAGSLVASNMLTNHKSVVWRSVGTSATITAAFPSSEMIGCIAQPFCNLTSTATIRVRGYADSEGNTLAFDTGTVLASPYSRFGSWQWGEEALGVNAFSFGGGAYASVWTTTVAVKKLVIDIVDSANTSGYIECSRLVAGPYWSPTYNPEYGTTAASQDSSKQYRTEAGDLLTDVGTTSRKVGLNLSVLVPEDRADLWRLIRNVGLSKPLFISVYPENTDVELEQAHQVFGKLSTLGSISASSCNIYSAPLELEEI